MQPHNLSWMKCHSVKRDVSEEGNKPKVQARSKGVAMLGSWIGDGRADDAYKLMQRKLGVGLGQHDPCETNLGGAEKVLPYPTCSNHNDTQLLSKTQQPHIQGNDPLHPRTALASSSVSEETQKACNVLRSGPEDSWSQKKEGDNQSPDAARNRLHLLLKACCRQQYTVCPKAPMFAPDGFTVFDSWLSLTLALMPGSGLGTQLTWTSRLHSWVTVMLALTPGSLWT